MSYDAPGADGCVLGVAEVHVRGVAALVVQVGEVLDGILL